MFPDLSTKDNNTDLQEGFEYNWWPVIVLELHEKKKGGEKQHFHYQKVNLKLPFKKKKKVNLKFVS